MKIAAIVARILFGLAFTLAGLMSLYLCFTTGAPAMQGYPLAEQFQSIAYRSHFVTLVGAVQFVTGILLLIDRYIPLALMATAAILVNILTYHITMMPIGIFPGLILTVCWIIIALQHQTVLLPLLSSRA